MRFNSAGDTTSLPLDATVGLNTAIPVGERFARQVSATEFEVDRMDPSAWDALIATFEDGRCEQLYSYAAGAWGSERLSHLVVKRGGRIIGAAQAVLLRPPGVDRGVAYVKFGPLWRCKGQTPRAADLEFILEALIWEYARRRSMHVTVLPRPEPEFTPLITKALGTCGFRSRRAMADPNRYLVDLSLGCEEQRQSLSQKWRYNLRRTECHAIDIDIEESPEALAIFKSLYRSMCRRKRFRDTSSYHALDDLFVCPNSGLHPKIILARHASEVIAGAVVGQIGDTATYLFGASNAKALELRAGYALHWWIIGWLARSEARWYDLGGEAEDPGLRQFKKGLVGKAGRIVKLPGEFDYCESSTSAFIAMMIYRVRDLRRACRSIADRMVPAKRL